jgi:C-terminal peptidase prc
MAAAPTDFAKARSMRRFATRVLLFAALLPVPARAQVADTVVPPAVTAALRHVLAQGYVSGVTADSLARFSTAGEMLLALRDRHTMLLSPQALAEFQVLAGQHFGGIGAKLGQRRDTTYITGVIPGSPAASAGLQAFDRILAVNDSSVVGTSVDSVVTRIRGPVGSTLRLTVLRPGDPPVSGPLRRAAVGIPSVPGTGMLDGGVGVVHLAQFGEGAASEFADAMDRLIGSGGLETVIIDMRGNPGGLLEEALAIASFFLPDGAPLVEIRPRPPQATLRQDAEGPARYPAALRVAVLVDQLSASASEVLAGALQDAQRATVFGRQSYGKGSVQQVVPLVDGWAVKMTIAKWYTPAGRGLDRGEQPADAEIDLLAPHEGGVTPEVTTAPDSSAMPPKGALEALPDTAWRVIGERLTDWTETIAREMQVPGAPTSAARAGEAMLAGLDVPAAVRGPLVTWLGQRVTAQAIAARFGEQAAEGFEIAHDQELAAVRAWLLAHPNG